MQEAFTEQETKDVKVNLEQMQLDSQLEIEKSLLTKLESSLVKYIELAKRIDDAAADIRAEINDQEERNRNNKKSIDLLSHAVCS